jgi:solute carrier family 13 (sodium-dependent dicarboxylate transporter), member 2/3/5
MRQKITLIAGPLVALIICLWPDGIFSPLMDRVLAIALWMVIWWIGEAVSLSVTALLPIITFPLLGVAAVGAVTQHYANPIVFLFFGGFVIALALEKVNLHKRFALNIVRITGTNANGIVLGFMIATAVLSMWISNTASTVVMLPIALSVISLLTKKKKKPQKKYRRFALSLMLGIAAAANIGGMATLIGTPPNSVMLAFLNQQYQIDIGFFQWMTFGVPFATVLLIGAYFVIVHWCYPSHLGALESSSEVIEQELSTLGKMGSKERTVLFIFLTTALLWMLRSQLNNWFPILNLTDTLIAMVAAIALFVVPAGGQKKPFVLQWEDTKNLPWGILILFGGGLALADALSQAGFIEAIQQFVAANDQWTVPMITVALIILVLFLTELMSNVALVTVFLPVIGGIALGLGAPLLHLIIPITLASSCAFMLPMATPPNAIVFASGYVSVPQMVKSGILLNLVAILLLLCFSWLLLPVVFS